MSVVGSGGRYVGDRRQATGDSRQSDLRTEDAVCWLLSAAVAENAKKGREKPGAFP